MARRAQLPLGGGGPSARTPRDGYGAFVREETRGVEEDPVCDGICFMPHEREVTREWRFVGAGRGGYEKMELYNFVGPGGGAYESAGPPPGSASWPVQRCLCILAVLAMVLLPCAYVFLSSPEEAPPTQAATQAASAPAQPIGPEDCAPSSGGWSQERRRWCCQVLGRGCRTATSTAPGFDCGVGFSLRDRGWSEEKKAFCCDSLGIACSTAAPTTSTARRSLPFDCAAGFANFQRGWSLAKREWCCNHLAVGCGPSGAAGGVAGHAGSFECSFDHAIEMDSWTEDRRAWCCWRHGLSCPVTTTTTLLPYNCSAGFRDWEDSWSRRKQSWCCVHFLRGCPPSTTPAPPLYNCVAGFSNWQNGWSESKKEWCCAQRSLGCNGTAPPAP